MHPILRKPVKKLLNNLGWNLVRFHTDPESTLLGLCHLPIRTILDIGANTGQSARHYRVLFPDATIYCFEPIPYVYRDLETWAHTQGGTVKAINIALGNETGARSMLLHSNHSPSSSLLASTPRAAQLYPQIMRQESISIIQRRLDDMEQELQLDKHILIKIDTQGTEDAVIQGGKHVIEQATGCIIEVSMQPLYEGQPSFAEIFWIMSRLRFTYVGNLAQSYDGEGRVTYIDTLFENSAFRQ